MVNAYCWLTLVALIATATALPTDATEDVAQADPLVQPKSVTENDLTVEVRSHDDIQPTISDDVTLARNLLFPLKNGPQPNFFRHADLPPSVSSDTDASSPQYVSELDLMQDLKYIEKWMAETFDEEDPIGFGAAVSDVSEDEQEYPDYYNDYDEGSGSLGHEEDPQEVSKIEKNESIEESKEYADVFRSLIPTRSIEEGYKPRDQNLKEVSKTLNPFFAHKEVSSSSTTSNGGKYTFSTLSGGKHTFNPSRHRHTYSGYLTGRPAPLPIRGTHVSSTFSGRVPATTSSGGRQIFPQIVGGSSTFSSGGRRKVFWEKFWEKFWEELFENTSKMSSDERTKFLDKLFSIVSVSSTTSETRQKLWEVLFDKTSTMSLDEKRTFLKKFLGISSLASTTLDKRRELLEALLTVLSGSSSTTSYGALVAALLGDASGSSISTSIGASEIWSTLLANASGSSTSTSHGASELTATLLGDASGSSASTSNGESELLATILGGTPETNGTEYNGLNEHFGTLFGETSTTSAAASNVENESIVENESSNVENESISETILGANSTTTSHDASEHFHGLFGATSSQGLTAASSDMSKMMLILNLLTQVDHNTVQNLGGSSAMIQVLSRQPARLIHPIIRFVVLMKNSPQNQWRNFLNTMRSRNSAEAYVTLMRMIQTENSKQQDLLEKLRFLTWQLQHQKTACSCSETGEEWGLF